MLNPGVSYALSLAGLARITASTSAVLWVTEPILIIAFAWSLLHQRPNRFVLAGSIVALASVLAVVINPGLHADLTGVALTVAGVGACALYTVASSRYLDDASPLTVVLAQQAAALGFAIALGTIAALTGHAGSLHAVSATAWASAVAAGALYYGVAFWFYLHGLASATPAFAGLFLNLVPVFAITTATVALHERLATRQWAGAALTVIAVTAVALTQTKRSVARLNNPTTTGSAPI